MKNLSFIIILFILITSCSSNVGDTTSRACVECNGLVICKGENGNAMLKNPDTDEETDSGVPYQEYIDDIELAGGNCNIISFE